VVQASSWWQQLFKLIESCLPLKVKSRALKRLYPRRFRGPGGWLIFLTSVVAMLFWNWKLLLATSGGVLVMLLVYLMQEWNWQLYWSNLRQFFLGSNRQLTIAVVSGSVASFGTYMGLSIFVNGDSSWITASAILQGLGTLTILILLVWQIISSQGSTDETQLEQMLRDLTNTDPLKRLLAVRQLTSWGVNYRLCLSEKRQVSDCFRLMLNREPETIIRDAILDALQVLGNNQRLAKEPQPFQTPIVLKPSATKLHHQRQ